MFVKLENEEIYICEIVKIALTHIVNYQIKILYYIITTCMELNTVLQSHFFFIKRDFILFVNKKYSYSRVTFVEPKPNEAHRLQQHLKREI